MIRRAPGRLLALSVVFVGVALPLTVSADGVIQLVPGTAVLLSNTTGSGSGGNGGNTSSASSSTNIFSPASYVDYHEVGGEPTTAVDRYPFGPGTEPSCTGAGATVCQQEAACPAGQTTCYHDFVYVSNPIGLPTYSEFYKSSDGGQTFRVPAHNPYFDNRPVLNAGGGGDSHHAVGELTHSVFFADLSGACVTMNISRDLGESFSSNPLGCQTNPGVIDDRQWVATDETAPGSMGGAVYMNFDQVTVPFLTGMGPGSIMLVKSNDDGGTNTAVDWNGAPLCQNTSILTSAADTSPTPCPDPGDSNLWITGPIVADKSAASPNHHTLYIPFVRNLGGTDFQLYVAISSDEGANWTRHLVHDIGLHDPANIFPELTVDTAGNLYYTWSQAQTFNPGTPQNEGETDAYYTYSTGGGLEGTWVPPIDLTKETGDSAVFPWMVAGSPGQVDLVMYKANSGLNPNIAFYNSSGMSCDPTNVPSGTTCTGNTAVWNTYFAESQNALNSGPNFKTVQISDHPIHTGGICTQGTACQSSAQQNRDLLDFLTIDVDHIGAAYTTWADDNNGRHDTRQFFSRQLSGNSILKGQNIAAMNSYPITDHWVSDPSGDVFNAAGLPETVASCEPAMDLLGTSAKMSNNNMLTVNLTFGAPPTSTQAIACANVPGGGTGGLWGAEFWAAATVNTAQDRTFPNDNFYIAYRDNPGDVAMPAPGVEAGSISGISPSLTHFEFEPQEMGTLGGTCLSSAGVANPTAPTPCTITMTAPLSTLGIKSGSILAAISGFSVYYFGSESEPPGFRVPLGNSNLADAATPFDINGTGTIVK